MNLSYSSRARFILDRCQKDSAKPISISRERLRWKRGGWGELGVGVEEGGEGGLRRGRREEGGGGAHTDRQPDTQTKQQEQNRRKKKKKKGRNIMVPDPRRLADKRNIRFVPFT